MEEYVTFEQAEILAKEFGYKEGCNTCYDAKTKEFLESHEKFNHNHPTWAGVYGWKYARYSAPTKDEAILYLMLTVEDMRNQISELYKKLHND